MVGFAAICRHTAFHGFIRLPSIRLWEWLWHNVLGSVRQWSFAEEKLQSIVEHLHMPTKYPVLFDPKKKKKILCLEWRVVNCYFVNINIRLKIWPNLWSFILTDPHERIKASLFLMEGFVDGFGCAISIIVRIDHFSYR